jgi:hypothetical protein
MNAPNRDPVNSNRSSRRPESWRATAASAEFAELIIPADAARERVFEISVLLSVRAGAAARNPWHQLRVLADGELQWSRRSATEHPAEFDGLDYRFTRRIGVGRALRLQAFCECQEARRLKLLIEADEI